MHPTNKPVALRCALIASLTLTAATVVGCSEHGRSGLHGYDREADYGYYLKRQDSATFDHGNAVRHNIAVQTIDPWAPHSANTRINMDGERALIAAKRYKANKTKEPKGLATQAISVGSGTGASSE